MEYQQGKGKRLPLSVKHKVEIQPISISTALFKITQSNDILGAKQNNATTLKFIQYLQSFSMTKSPAECQQISKHISKLKQTYKEVNQKELIQIWNLGLRCVDDINSLLPSVAKCIPQKEVETLIALLEAKNK